MTTTPAMRRFRDDGRMRWKTLPDPTVTDAGGSQTVFGSYFSPIGFFFIRCSI